nr:MAG TPA: hypothetical protein [Caudoviricetes sp.]
MPGNSFSYLIKYKNIVSFIYMLNKILYAG